MQDTVTVTIPKGKAEIVRKINDIIERLFDPTIAENGRLWKKYNLTPLSVHTIDEVFWDLVIDGKKSSTTNIKEVADFYEQNGFTVENNQNISYEIFF